MKKLNALLSLIIGVLGRDVGRGSDGDLNKQNRENMSLTYYQ